MLRWRLGSWLGCLAFCHLTIDDCEYLDEGFIQIVRVDMGQLVAQDLGEGVDLFPIRRWLPLLLRQGLSPVKKGGNDVSGLGWWSLRKRLAGWLLLGSLVGATLFEDPASLDGGS